MCDVINFFDNEFLAENLSDVTLRVVDRNDVICGQIQLHRFFLMMTSLLFAEILCKSDDDVIIVRGVSYPAIRDVITTLYGNPQSEDRNDDDVTTNKEACIEFGGISRKLMTSSNLKLLESFKPTFVTSSTPTAFKTLYDCKIACDDDVIIEAHRCVLAARIPYFVPMMTSWKTHSDDVIFKVQF